MQDPVHHPHNAAIHFHNCRAHQIVRRSYLNLRQRVIEKLKFCEAFLIN